MVNGVNKRCISSEKDDSKMELSNAQRMVMFQAIEEKLFKQFHHIRDLEKLEQTKEMKYHIGNLKSDQELLTQVRNQLQSIISLNQ